VERTVFLRVARPSRHRRIEQDNVDGHGRGK
jgi:hypothetical protein